jgi:hypothetical protein
MQRNGRNGKASAWKERQHVSPKRWYISTELQGVKCLKTGILTAMTNYGPKKEKVN